MINHTVLLKPKSDISSEAIAIALLHVRELQQTIPGIVDVQAGPNHNTTNNHGYTYGFEIRFTDSDALKAYAPHPAHKLVSDELVSISESIIDFDLTIAA
jgi:hypothetical protein